MDNKTYAVRNNEKEQRFEITMEGEIAFLEYRFYKKDMALMHTVVPDSLSGKSIATVLAKHALDWAREHHKPVMVYCPFVAAYLKRHPEYSDLIDKNYHQ